MPNYQEVQCQRCGIVYAPGINLCGCPENALGAEAALREDVRGWPTAAARRRAEAALREGVRGWAKADAALGTDSFLAGVKHDQGKPRMELLDAHALEQLALVLTFGAEKYQAHNWRKGLSKGRLLGAALRHLFAYLRGEDRDAESGLSHVAHAMCCCMFLLGLEHRPELDDRWKGEPT